MTHAADFWYVGYEAEAYAYGTEPNAYFRRQLDALPPSHLLLEAFNPRQLGLSSGGPREAELLYEPAQLAADFTGLTLLENYEVTVLLREGSFLAGTAQMVRLLAQRPANSNLSTELTYSI